MTEASSVAANRALVERYFAECVNRMNGPDRTAALGVVESLLAPDFVMTYNSEPEAKGERGTARHQAFLVHHARAYPDDEWTIESLVADVDTAACIWRIRATHAESGNRIDVRAADFYVIRDGRLASLRRFLDFEDLHAQTGPKG
jgi:ketosteroid isomerase-like protein